MTPSPSLARNEPPRVFVEKVKGALRIAAIDRQAHNLGLHPGLALTDARARVPNIAAEDMDPAADNAFIDRMADFCDRYTPFIANDHPHGLILDITGCAHLFNGEENLRQDLLTRLKKGGAEAHASIAGTPDTARALARFGGRAIALSDEETMAVTSLPAMAIGTSPETITALARAGLKTIGDVTRQPRQPLAARFGEAFIVQLSRTLGEKDARINARRPVPPYMAEQRFAEPIAHEDDMLATLNALCLQIARLLETRGEGGRRFEATFFRTDGRISRIDVETGRPQREPGVIMRLFRERLAALADPLDSGFGFDLIRLAVIDGDSFIPVQTGLDSTDNDEEEVAALTDRLSTRFGTTAVKRFVAVDTHIPEGAAYAGAALRVKDAAAWEMPVGETVPARPIHLFDPPQPIEALAEVPDGPPLKFRWRRMVHDIARAEGPERIAAEWWRHDGLTRDYYRVEDSAGHRYWVFREGLYGTEAVRPHWFLHGVFA